MSKPVILAALGSAAATAAVFSLGALVGPRPADVAATQLADSTPVVPAPAAAPVPPAWADILKVSAVRKTTETPRQVCQQYTHVETVPARDPERVTGKVLGALIGGVVGHQFGGGSGKDAATAGGAILGGIIGDRVQQDRQQAQQRTRVETRCDTIVDTQEKTVGYDVTYRYDGREDVIRLGYQPASRVPVRDARIVFEPWGGATLTPVTLPVPQ